MVNGTRDYSLLRGDTGPLVYPAGFVWLYMGLYWVTSQGANIRLAQYIFAGLYLATLALVFRILARTEKVPPYILVLMSLTSHRIHSIFVLRLFNDPVAVLFMYLAINLWMDDHISLGSFFFSLAVSIKMNILLYAPAVLLFYISNLGKLGALVQLAICAGVQLVVGFPFLASHPMEYIIGAFNLGQVFLYEWTVNFRFLPEDIFVSRIFHIVLLAGHLTALACCAGYWWKYFSVYRKLHKIEVPNCEQLLILPLFMCNFIGVMFARSLHYQFYVWYYHTLHYLAWATPFPVKFRLNILGIFPILFSIVSYIDFSSGVIELAWNTVPSTSVSSLCLHVSHVFLLAGLVRQVSNSCEMTMFTSVDRTQETKRK